MGKFYSDQNFTKPATNALMNARNGLVSGSVDFLDAPSHDSLQNIKYQLVIAGESPSVQTP